MVLVVHEVQKVGERWSKRPINSSAFELEIVFCATPLILPPPPQLSFVKTTTDQSFIARCHCRELELFSPFALILEGGFSCV